VEVKLKQERSDMYMKLKSPDDLKELLAVKKGWLTNLDIATGASLGINTVFRVFNGEPARASTIKKLADAAKVAPMTIAEFIQEVE
jgi:hypothetical protein